MEEMDTVQNTQAAEHRRVEEDQDGQAEADWRFEQQHREKRERQAEEELDEFEREIKEIELRAEQRMKQVGVGGGLDITV
ncbi:MAG TPA: hypothetical protein DEB31_01885 [Clostridiales bacterium]|nr:hypothetical protein [Clostridiales bacterium]